MLLQKKSTATLEEIEYLSRTLNISKAFAEVLVGRGIKTEQDFVRFCNPIDNPLNDPFLMPDMATVVRRVRKAIDSGETIVIYSDYDADGVCSAVILYKFLCSQGVEPYVYLPDRQNEGYGVHIEAIEFIAEEYSPDLIITCDCGISAADEVDYILDLGMDVIVTDHHELPSTLPSCPILNCKIEGYPFPDLCGAGVVLKLVQAMSGDIESCIDMCAIATVADLVSLTDENRTIVARGLRALNTNPSKSAQMLMDSLGISSISSTDISYRIAPRINAAGRMGDAIRALRFFISEDEMEMKQILSQLNSDNEVRKKLVDKIYAECLERLKGYNLSEHRVIVLDDEGWEKGVTGIVCAKISGEFCRPTFLLSKSGSCYKATARSIPSVNVYELLHAHKHLLLEFGGHSQAAGFSILGENIPALRESVNAYLYQHYSNADFNHCLSFDTELDCKDLSLELVKELNMLEPFGLGNPRPSFAISSRCLRVSEMKGNVHLMVSLDGGAEMPVFNQRYLKELFLSNTNKKLVVELDISHFRGEQLRVNLKDFTCGQLEVEDDLVNCQYLSQLAYPNSTDKAEQYNNVEEVLKNGNIYGTLVIAFSQKSYQRFFTAHGEGFLQRFFQDSTAGNRNKVLLAPRGDFCADYYSQIVLLDPPLSSGYVQFLFTKCPRVLVKSGEVELPKVDCNRDTLLRCYSAIKESEHLKAQDFYDYASNLKFNYGITYSELMLSVLIFSELKIVQISKKPYNIRIDKNIKAELALSRVYRLFNP